MSKVKDFRRFFNDNGLHSCAMRPLGEFLKVRAAKVGLPTLKAIAAAHGRSRQSTVNFLNAATPDEVEGSQWGNREALAQALNFNEWQDLIKAWEDDDVMAGLEVEEEDQEDKRIIATREIPRFHGVTAARRDDRASDVSNAIKVPADWKGEFAVVIRNKCMEPSFPEGSTVVFSRSEGLSEGFVDGRAYLIWFANGESTFKRVFHDRENREMIHLRAANPDQVKYPPMHIRRGEITFIAKPVGLILE